MLRTMETVEATATRTLEDVVSQFKPPFRPSFCWIDDEDLDESCADAMATIRLLITESPTFASE
jgi:hypothetical protein